MIRHFLWTVWPCENVDCWSPNVWWSFHNQSWLHFWRGSTHSCPAVLQNGKPLYLVLYMQFNSIFEYSLLGNQSYVTAQREWQPVSQLPHVVFCNEPSHVQNSDSSCTEGLYNRATPILFHGWSTPAYSFSVSSCQLSCQGTCAILMNWVDFGS